MADKMRLTDGVDTIDFSPGAKYKDAEDRTRSVHNTMDGTTYIYEWGAKEGHEVPLDGVTLANKIIIETWWKEMTQLTFYPDLDNAPGSSIQVRIINDDPPLQMTFPDWQGEHEGELVLKQI